MYVGIELSSNIDNYVAVYLMLKKNSLLCLITYNKYNFISPISFQKIKIKFRSPKDIIYNCFNNYIIKSIIDGFKLSS